jgi:hypothetical protein
MKYYPNNLIFIKILCFIPKDFVGSVSLVLFYGIVTTRKRNINAGKPIQTTESNQVLSGGFGHGFCHCSLFVFMNRISATVY